MINTSEAFAGKIRESSRYFTARFLSGNLEVAGSIRRIIVHWGSCGADNLVFGAVFSSYIEVQMDGNESALEGQELQLQFGLKTEDDVYEYIGMGHYTVEHPATSAYDTTFTAKGRIATKMAGLFIWPESLSISSITAALSSQSGLQIRVAAGIDTSLRILKQPKDMSCRDALGVIASVVGGYATEMPDGSVLIGTYTSTPNIDVDGNLMIKLPTRADYNNTINGIKVVVSAETTDEDGDATPEISYSSGNVDTEVECEYMTEVLFGPYAERIVGFSYRPATIPLALGDPRIQPQDVLRVTDIRGDEYIVPCMSIIHTYDGGIQTEIKSPNPDTSTSIKGSLGKAVNELKMELLEVQRLFAKYARIDLLNVDRIESKDGSTYWDLTTNDLCLGGYLLNATPEYAVSEWPDIPPETGWSDEALVHEDGKYAWQRIALHHGDGTTEYTEAVCLQGIDGERGTGIWKITTAPSSYTTIVGDFTPRYRVALSTVLSQSGASEIKVGDIIERSYNHYVVGYVDSTYVYLGAATSIRGSQGPPGTSVTIKSVVKQNGETVITLTDSSGDTTLTISDGEDGENGHPGLSGYVHLAWANSADGTVDFSTSSAVGKTYLGSYTDNVATDSSNPQDYSWARIQGPQGEPGTNGDDGVGIASERDLFTITDSDSDVPDDPETDPTIWTADTPSSRVAGEYIWRCHETTYTDDSVMYSTPVCITGDPGDQGEQGERGTGILKITSEPSAYSTQVEDYTPEYRILKATVETQARVSKVLVGDILEYSYYHYPVGYVDDQYVYTGPRTSIRGAQGQPGTNGTDGDDALTLYINTDAGLVTQADRVVTTTWVGEVHDGTGTDIDPDGELYGYRWWQYKDESAKPTYLGAGKSITLIVDGRLCDLTSSVFFEITENPKAPIALTTDGYLYDAKIKKIARLVKNASGTITKIQYLTVRNRWS